METRTLSPEDLERILGLMQDTGSLAYAMERAKTYIAAAQHELEAFEDSSARRALAVAADYMITRDR